MSSLLSAILVGLIIMIIAISLTFLTMASLILVVKMFTGTKMSLKPIQSNQSILISNEVQYEKEYADVAIVTAISMYLEQEKKTPAVRITNKVLKINPSSPWEILGRHNHFIRRYKR